MSTSPTVLRLQIVSVGARDPNTGLRAQQVLSLIFYFYYFFKNTAHVISTSENKEKDLPGCVGIGSEFELSQGRKGWALCCLIAVVVGRTSSDASRKTPLGEKAEHEGVTASWSDRVLLGLNDFAFIITLIVELSYHYLGRPDSGSVGVLLGNLCYRDAPRAIVMDSCV